MCSCVEEKLPDVRFDALPLDRDRPGISGYAIGVHGALTIGWRDLGRFRSAFALAAIVSTTGCPWGEKALGGYFGADRTSRRRYDSCALIADGVRLLQALVDQGPADGFLKREFKPYLLEGTCRDADMALTLDLQPGYDNSYVFIDSVIEDHLRWHGARFQAQSA